MIFNFCYKNLHKIWNNFFARVVYIFRRGDWDMENNILLVDEKEKENARALTQSFVKKDVKSRAYTNALGAEVIMRYLKDENISDGEVYNIHNIRKILEEFDISDIMLKNIHLDIRIVYNDNEIFIPKSHFEYNLVPDLYLVLQINKDYSQVEFLGFFEPKMLNKNNANSEYYFMEKEKLSSPVDLKNFIENFKGSTSEKYSETDLDDAEVLFVSMVDHNVSDTDKKKLLGYLKNSAELRDRFIEFENFEMLSYKTANDETFDAITLPESDETNKVSIEEGISTDDIFENSQIEDIENTDTESTEDLLDTENVFDEALNTEDLTVNDLSTEENISDETNDKSGSGLIGDMLSGAAIAGAEIAGAAMASAALTGAAEVAGSASAIVGAAEVASDVAETTLDAISDSADILSQANDDSQNVMGMTDTLDELNSMNITENTEISEAMDGLTDGIDELFSDNEMTTEEQESADQQNAVAQEDSYSSDMGSLDDLFGDTTEDMSFDENSSSNDIEFGNTNEDNDIVFENNDNYDDDIVFENNDDYDDYDDNSSSNSVSHSSGNSASSIKQGIPAAISTPISEATDLVSLENIQLGNLPPADIPSDIGSQMETMEMDEFHSLVDNYVPTEIKDESITVDFNNIEDTAIPGATNKDDLSSDDFIEDMPEEINDLSDIKKDDLSSDDFTEDMPEEINNLSSDDITLSNVDNTTSESLASDIQQEIAEVTDLTDETESITDDFDDDIFGINDATNTQASIEDVDDFTDIKNDNHENADDEQLPEGVDFSSGLNIGEIPEVEVQQPENDFTDYDTTDTSSVLSEDIEITEEPQTQVADDMALLDDISALEDISEGQTISSSEDDFDDEDAVPAGFTPITSDEESDSSLGMLYSGSENNINGEELVDESYDFRPKRKFSIMPIFAFITVAIIAATVVGFLVKNKNSIDSETLIQSAPENGILESPENDNSNVLANQEIVPAIPTDETAQNGNDNTAATGNVELSKEAKDNAIKEAKESIKQQSSTKVVVESKKPLNANKNITLKKLSWQLPNYLSHSMNMNKYLQAAGKSIKLTLSSDLLLTNEYIYSNQVKVNLKLSNDGTIQNASVVSSSGSNQVDKIVLQTVKNTLNVVKPVRGEVPTQTFNLGLIIYL